VVDVVVVVVVPAVVGVVERLVVVVGPEVLVVDTCVDVVVDSSGTCVGEGLALGSAVGASRGPVATPN
jgi:hypothetical protein